MSTYEERLINVEHRLAALELQRLHEQNKTPEPITTPMERRLREIHENSTFLLGLLARQGEHVQAMKDGIGAVKDRVERVETRLDSMNRHMYDVDKHLEGIDQRLDGMDRRFDAVDQRFDGIDQRLDGMDRRFDGLEQHIEDGFSSMNEKFERVVNVLVTVTSKLDKLGNGS